MRDPLSGLAVSQNDGTAKRWYAQDNLGTTIALTHGAGALARSYDTEPDGSNTTSGSGPAAVLQFAGGQQLGSTGVYHFGARYYDTVTARWTSQDPLRQYADLTQANRYSYAGGDPVNFADPAGDSIFGDIAAGIGIGITGASCTLVETGVGAALCLGGLAAGSAGLADSLSSD